MRRSKSLGRPHNTAFISSSSNDEGISKAYFQRLQRRGQTRDQFLPARDIMSQRFSRNRDQFMTQYGAADRNPDWEQEEVYKHEERKVIYVI